MKLTLSILVLALQATKTLAAGTTIEPTALAEECGDLGVLQIPPGTDPTLYRHCAGHPLGSNRREHADQSLAPAEQKRSNAGNIKAADIFGRKEQACYWDAALGCSGGYCWKACGNPGEWCWTAAGDGGGDWLQCRSYNDCSSSANCGKNCKAGDKACGCSC